PDHPALIQRPDDKEEVIAKRLEVYEAQTRPLIEHYSRLGLLTTVAGEGELDDVFARMETAALGGAPKGVKKKAAPPAAKKAGAPGGKKQAKPTKNSASAKAVKKKVAKKPAKKSVKKPKTAAKKSAPRKKAAKKKK